MHTAVVVAVVTCLLGGCTAGAQLDAESPTAARAVGSPSVAAAADEDMVSAVVSSPDPEHLRISQRRFCARVDASRAARAVGVLPAAFTLHRDLRPGQTYRVRPGSREMTAETWSCEWSTRAVQGATLAVSVSREPVSVQQFTLGISRDQHLGSSGIRAGCDRADDPAYGRNGTVLVCTRPQVTDGGRYQSGYGEAVFAGLFGDVVVECRLSVWPQADAFRVASAGARVCRDVLGTVSR